jgi:hypothetical protein
VTADLAIKGRWQPHLHIWRQVLSQPWRWCLLQTRGGGSQPPRQQRSTSPPPGGGVHGAAAAPALHPVVRWHVLSIVACVHQATCAVSAGRVTS